MSIYLAQHGLSNPKETDADQKLSGQGIADVTRIAEVAHGYSVNVSMICHSGKDRASMTAEIFNLKLSPARGVKKIDCINPMDDVESFAASLDSTTDIMYVGHLPFMEKLTSYLVAGRTDIRVFHFQNGGLVCLDKDNDAHLWHIKWTLMPKID